MEVRELLSTYEFPGDEVPIICGSALQALESTSTDPNAPEYECILSLIHILKVSVIVPEEYMGDVIGDLNSRRGQIQGMEARSGAQQIDAFVPLSEMFGYATDLRSRTQGRGQYTMEPSHYTEVPKSIQEKIIAGK